MKPRAARTNERGGAQQSVTASSPARFEQSRKMSRRFLKDLALRKARMALWLTSSCLVAFSCDHRGYEDDGRSARLMVY